jgi:hypothetical protein
MNISIRHSLAIVFLLLVAGPQAANAQSSGGPGSGGTKPRIPVGIYAVVRVEEARTTYGSDLSGLYATLLSNQAVSGLAIQVHWDTLNPLPPTETGAYTWDPVDQAFASVALWNTENPNAATQKTIQLIVSPGFNSPQWVRDELTSCDGLFYFFGMFFPLPTSDCGYATFTNYAEIKQSDSNELPMPWNTTYQTAWKTFLQALATKYNGNPSLVSVAVAGPTAVSAEMLLPNGDTVNQFQFAHELCFVFGGCIVFGLPTSPNAMWKQLLSNAGLPDTTDQAFVTAWDGAIDIYGGIFSGITLTAATGNGLPLLTLGDAKGDFPPPTTPINFAPDCTYVDGSITHYANMDCQAETEILSYFMESGNGGSNAKAVQTSGLEYPQQSETLGMSGVKFVSLQTATPPAGGSQVLGGAQFDQPFSVSPENEGDAKAPQRALFNVLSVYFSGTAVATQYCDASVTNPAPLNYLQIYYQDFTYMNVNVEATFSECYGPFSVSAQGEMNVASTNLFLIFEP